MDSKWRLVVLVIALAGLLVATSVLVGCAASAPESKPGTPQAQSPVSTPAKQEVKTIRWGTSSVGSGGYNLSAKIADMAKKYAGLDINITPVGGSEATIRSIARGERDIGFGTADAIYNAYNGVSTFSKDGKQPILLVANTYISAMVYVAQPGITSVPEFKGKTVCYRRAPAPIFGIFGDAILKAWGLDPDKDVKNVSSVETREQVDGMKTGSMDVAMFAGATPGATIPELFEARQFNIIDMGKDKIEPISKANPFLMPYLIKANTYKGQAKDAYTQSYVQVIFAKTDIPDKVVYDITKTMWSHLDELATADPVAKTITLEAACKNPVIPLHPGAIQYYKEAGVLK